jgi:hypothetical protein
MNMHQKAKARRAVTLLAVMSVLEMCLPSAYARPEPLWRWVQASPLLLRQSPKPDGLVTGRLQQGTRVTLTSEDPSSGYCDVSTDSHWGGFVACRHLSATPVAPKRAGEEGVPPDRRWAAGSGLVLRAQAQRDAPVLGRLALNTELTLGSDQSAAANGYCAVETVPVAGAAALKGFTACQYLASSPVAPERMSVAEVWDGKRTVPNPDFNPRRLFALKPSWNSMARYITQQSAPCEDEGRCPPRDADFAEALADMRRQLHGQFVAEMQVPAPLARWPQIAAGTPATDQPNFPLNAWNQEGTNGSQALGRALAVPAARPSWFRDEEELAPPSTSLSELAHRFHAKKQLFVGALLPGHSPEDNSQVARLTRPLHRIELLADGRVTSKLVTPEVVNVEWDPDRDYRCEGWAGPGFAAGDIDAATRKRNQFGEVPPPAGPLRLFWFYSNRALPAGKAQTQREVVKLDRRTTGFVSMELRRIDLEGDGVPDLLWVEATGRGPGHLQGPPAHDDPWYRLLLVNIGGEWRVLGEDQITYGCGC